MRENLFAGLLLFYSKSGASLWLLDQGSLMPANRFSGNPGMKIRSNFFFRLLCSGGTGSSRLHRLTFPPRPVSDLGLRTEIGPKDLPKARRKTAERQTHRDFHQDNSKLNNSIIVHNILATVTSCRNGNGKFWSAQKFNNPLHLTWHSLQPRLAEWVKLDVLPGECLRLGCFPHGSEASRVRIWNVDWQGRPVDLVIWMRISN